MLRLIYMFFHKSKVVLWPGQGYVDVYFDRKENNTLKLDIDLFAAPDPTQLQSFNTYLSQNKISQVDILIPDDIILTKSFLYDSQISTIDKKEVVGLAESFVPFKINPESLEFNLIQTPDKTIIQSRIYENSKINQLKSNLAQTVLKSYNLVSVSSAISKVISTEQKNEYFFLFPLNPHESTLILSKGDSVYLTSNFKNSSLDIQKIINYSNLYFTSKTNTLYFPQDQELNITATSELSRIPYQSANFALKFGKASNLPLPVIGCIIDSSMENQSIAPAKKNLLPLVAVFVVTAAIASVVIWYFLNNNNSSLQNPNGNLPSPTVTQEAPTPTLEPTPTIVAEISKKLKLQVLNATDINGQAATLKERLMKLGFSSVTVGNSTEKSTSNIIRLKAESASTSAYFIQNMTGFFANPTTETLPANSTYDAVFVIGEKLGTAAAPVVPTTAAVASPTAVIKKVSPTPTITE